MARQRAPGLTVLAAAQENPGFRVAEIVDQKLRWYHIPNRAYSSPALIRRLIKLPYNKTA